MRTEVREDGTRAGAVSGTETPLSVAKILSGRSFSRRVADIFLGAVVGTGLDIVEGLGGVMEKVYGWMDGDYRRHMAALGKGGTLLDKLDLPAEINGKSNPLLRERYPDNWVHIIGRLALGFYMRMYHRLDVSLDPEMPKQGPALFLTNHDSHLTTVTLMVADPYYPPTTVPIKSEIFQNPIARRVLTAWGAIPVRRDGRDRQAVAQMLHLLEEGRTVCIAAEGTRSRLGGLQPMDSSLVSLALICARRGYPVVPIVELGTYRALPKGAKVPLPYKISVRGGKPMDLSPWAFQGVTLEVKTAAAQYMQDTLAALLPPDQRPKSGTLPMWNKGEYLPAEGK